MTSGARAAGRPRRAPQRPFDHDPELLTWARKKDGRTQAQLADAAGISRGHMNEIENGTRNAPPHLITKFAEILNCPRSVLERKISGNGSGGDGTAA